MDTVNFRKCEPIFLSLAVRSSIFLWKLENRVVYYGKSFLIFVDYGIREGREKKNGRKKDESFTRFIDKIENVKIILIKSSC